MAVLIKLESFLVAVKSLDLKVKRFIFHAVLVVNHALSSGYLRQKRVKCTNALILLSNTEKLKSVQ